MRRFLLHLYAFVLMTAISSRGATPFALTVDKNGHVITSNLPVSGVVDFATNGLLVNGVAVVGGAGSSIISGTPADGSPAVFDSGHIRQGTDQEVLYLSDDVTRIPFLNAAVSPAVYDGLIPSSPLIISGVSPNMTLGVDLASIDYSDFTGLQGALDAKQDLTGTLALGNFGAITGTVPFANLPTGTSGSTVAIGNHTHTFSSLTSKPTTLSGYGITDALSTIPSGKAVYVDSVNGNDGTGTAHRADLPFLTLGAAKAAASGGDTVFVGPGSYTITSSLATDGVDWYFDAGATVTESQDSTSNGIWDDLGSAMTFNVYGFGSFVRTTLLTSDSVADQNLIRCSDGSTITVHANDITYTAPSEAAQDVRMIDQRGGELHASFRNAIITGATGSAKAIWWQGGRQYVSGDYAYSDYWTIGSASEAGENSYIRSDDIVSGTGAGSAAVACSGTDTSAAMWVDSLTIHGGTISVSHQAGNKLYVHAQKLFGFIETTGSTYAGLLYVTADKVSAVGTGKLLSLTSGTIASRIEVKHWEPGSTSSQTLVKSGGSTDRITGGDLTGTSSNAGISLSAGTLDIDDLSVDTSARSATNAITVTGGTLNARDCWLTSNASGFDFSRSSGTVNITGGRGTNADGTFTTSGTVSYVSTALRKDANLSDLTSASTARGNLGLGTLATQSGTFSGTSSGTNTGDQDLSGYQTKAGTLALAGFSSITGTVSGSNVSGGTLGATAGTNLTGTAASLTAGHVTTNANLTGEVTSSGNAASLGSFTMASFKTALSDETTVVNNLLSLANPSAISFVKIAADNTVSTRTPAQVLSDIGAQASGSYAASGANSDITSLSGVTAMTGGAGNMTITAGTGNSRTMALQTTTSGGTATTFLTGNADQTATFAGAVNATSGNYTTLGAFIGYGTGTSIHLQANSGGIALRKDGIIKWNDTVVGGGGNIFGTGSFDSGVVRDGVNGTQSNDGTLASGTTHYGYHKAKAFIPGGPDVTCTGGTIGTGSKNHAGFVTSTTTGTSTVVVTFSVTAPIGWSIMATDITSGIILPQTAKSTTTATFAGATTSGDVIQYISFPY